MASTLVENGRRETKARKRIFSQTISELVRLKKRNMEGWAGRYIPTFAKLTAKATSFGQS